jgi:hypothetical protein
VTVPDFTGADHRTAKEMADRSGLVFGQIKREESDRAAGTVLSQQPPAGTRVNRGTPVNLIIAVKPRETVATAPRQLSPADGATFSSYPRTTTLRWQPLAGAARYSVEIDCLHCCESGRWCSEVGRPWKVVPNLTTTTYTFNFVGAQPGRWRVWAMDSQGRAGAKSPWRTFTYTK